MTMSCVTSASFKTVRRSHHPAVRKLLPLRAPVFLTGTPRQGLQGNVYVIETVSREALV